MTAGRDQRRVQPLAGFDLSPAGLDRTPRAEPGFDFHTREQQLAGHLTHRQSILCDQIINFARLDAQKRGQFAGGVKFRHFRPIDSTGGKNDMKYIKTHEKA